METATFFEMPSSLKRRWSASPKGWCGQGPQIYLRLRHARIEVCSLCTLARNACAHCTTRGTGGGSGLERGHIGRPGAAWRNPCRPQMGTPGEVEWGLNRLQPSEQRRDSGPDWPGFHPPHRCYLARAGQPGYPLLQPVWPFIPDLSRTLFPVRLVH